MDNEKKRPSVSEGQQAEVDAGVGGSERGGVLPQRGPAADEQATADVSADQLFQVPDAWDALRAKDAA